MTNRTPPRAPGGARAHFEATSYGAKFWRERQPSPNDWIIAPTRGGWIVAPLTTAAETDDEPDPTLDPNYDPTPYCAHCGARRMKDCDCGPLPATF